MGIEAYPVYDNLPITEAQKQDPEQLLAAFEKYFKPERNIFPSWYASGSIYSGAFKTQSEFYHKLNSVANDCNFTNKEEIVKFLFLTHNQNTRVCEHLLKEMQDMTSMTDMLHMASVCEGTAYSEEISKQYLESIKTVKQVDAINQHQRSASKGRGHGRDRGQSQSQQISQSKGRPSGNCSNCGSSHPPKRCKAFSKECYHCHKKGHFSQYCRSKQCGRSPSQTKFNGSRQSHHNVHNIGIDQSQFDDAPQFEQDSVTIEFKHASQWRHSNIMFDEISTSASLQSTDQCACKINWCGPVTLAEGKIQILIVAHVVTFMPLGMYKLLYSKKPSASTINQSIHLLDYNKQEIKQLGTCKVLGRFRTIMKPVYFYIMSDRLKPIIVVSDALSLGLTSFHCPVCNNWHDKQDLLQSIDSIQNGLKLTVPTELTKTNMPVLTKESIINHSKYSHLFTGICWFKCKPVHITTRQNGVPIQKPPRKVPLVMREKFKKELDSMETQGIISKFDGRDMSPESLNSFVIVKKPNGSLRICLDPTDLNKEVVRPVCNSQTMDDIIEKLKGARYFAVFDTSKGFMYLWTRNQKC